MKNKTLSVPEVHCEHCVGSIEGAVGALEGIKQAKVDLTDRTVTVDYDPDQVGMDKIVAAIEDQGYDVGGDGLMQIGRPPEDR